MGLLKNLPQGRLGVATRIFPRRGWSNSPPFLRGTRCSRFRRIFAPPQPPLCAVIFWGTHPGCPFFETRPWWFGNAGPLKSPLWFTELKCLIFQLKGVLFLVASAGSFSQSNQRAKDQQLKSIYRALVGWPGSPSKVRHIEVLKPSGW